MCLEYINSALGYSAQSPMAHILLGHSGIEASAAPCPLPALPPNTPRWRPRCYSLRTKSACAPNDGKDMCSKRPNISDKLRRLFGAVVVSKTPPRSKGRIRAAGDALMAPRASSRWLEREKRRGGKEADIPVGLPRPCYQTAGSRTLKGLCGIPGPTPRVLGPIPSDSS